MRCADPFQTVSHTLVWISEIMDVRPIESTGDQMFYNAIDTNGSRSEDNQLVFQETSVLLLLLGNRNECTQEFIHEFARIYSIPTYENISHWSDSVLDRNYSKWLQQRNSMILGFT